MKKFQKRIIEEHNQLGDKLDKLEEFMNDCDKFCILPEAQRDLLETQRSAMLTYIRILEVRLKSMGLWPEDPEEDLVAKVMAL